MTLLKASVLFFVATLAAGCGFRPIYAAPEDGGAPLNQLVAIRSIAAPDTVLPLISEALNDRIVLKEGQSPKYDLYVETQERADRLAIQIDASVTRYNYRLLAQYTLVNLETGARTRGRAQSVTSYNIVSSQYSTLFAERAAQEKAARQLAEEIERDLLIRFSAIAEGAGEGTDEEALPSEMGIDPETDTPTTGEEPDVTEIFEPERRRR